VLVAVTDTGTGMPPEVLARAFDPFFTTKETGKGTGLGLSMVYGFVQQSKGHVRIESEEGRGTSVRLYLPRWAGQARAPSPSEQEEQTPEVLGAASEGIVLVVEDDPEVRHLSVQMLADLGYHVIEAADPDVALDALAREPGVRLLFTDVVMPDIDGRRLADLARTIRPGLRVLLTTGYARDLVTIEEGSDPSVSLLPKPFTLEQLAAKLRESIG
jgi:CheY-like chemotaxis protein